MSPNNVLVTTINGTGAVIELVYVVVFLVYASKNERVKVGALFVSILAMFGVVSAVSLLALRGSQRILFCGVVATFFSICMYASPLSVMVSFKISTLNLYV